MYVFQKHILPFLAEVFMPIVTTIFSVLSAPIDDRDQVAANERRMLQRGYYSFLATLANNNVADVLANQGQLRQKPYFHSMTCLTLITSNVKEYCY